MSYCLVAVSANTSDAKEKDTIKDVYKRQARNISKNTTMIIPAHNIPAFKPSDEFLKMVKQQNA